MRVVKLSVAGAVASVFLFGSVGSVSAIEPYDLSSVSLQYQREVRSTYIIQFQPGVAASEVQGRANAIAARFNGRLRHTYTRALSGFAIRMNSTAMARLQDAGDLGIARISRGVIMTVAQANDNAALKAPDGKGKPDKNTAPECSETLGWNVKRVTSLDQNPLDESSSSCKVVVEGTAQLAVSYAQNSPKVCVLDTGVSLHPDINIVGGYRSETVTGSTNADDVYGHGTHVAGIIGAYANNADGGVVGVAPGVPIYSIKVLGDDGSGSDFDVIAGIDQAIFQGCAIVNMSLGGSKSIPLDTAIIQASTSKTLNNNLECDQYAEDRKGNPTGPELCLEYDSPTNNIIFTLAAGNSAADINGYSPARASTSGDDNIFTIASFGQDSAKADLWSSFSNYGPDDFGIVGGNESMVDFALPGGKILSTVPDNTYDTFNGTSMAAPHMAGLIVRYIADGIGSTAICPDGLIGPVCVLNSYFNSGVDIVRYIGFARFYVPTDPEDKYSIATD